MSPSTGHLEKNASPCDLATADVVKQSRQSEGELAHNEATSHRDGHVGGDDGSLEWEPPPSKPTSRSTFDTEESDGPRSIRSTSSCDSVSLQSDDNATRELGYKSFQSAWNRLIASITPWTLAPRRKQVALWTCCVCGQSGMSMRTDPCENCGTPRCMYCKVDKFKSKPAGLFRDLQ